MHLHIQTCSLNTDIDTQRERETCKCDEGANACMLCKCLYTLVSIHVKEQASFYKMLNLFFTCKKHSVHKLQLIYDLFFLWWNLILFHINRNINITGCPDKAKILHKNISSWTLFCATLIYTWRREKKERFTNHSYVAVGVAMQTRIGMVVMVHFSWGELDKTRRHNWNK